MNGPDDPVVDVREAAPRWIVQGSLAHLLVGGLTACHLRLTGAMRPLGAESVRRCRTCERREAAS